MTDATSLLSQPLIESVGWALLHFLWQGTVLAILLAVSLRFMRRCSANAKYVVSFAALVLMAASIPVTTGLVYYSDLPSQSHVADSAADAVFANQNAAKRSLNHDSSTGFDARSRIANGEVRNVGQQIGPHTPSASHRSPETNSAVFRSDSELKVASSTTDTKPQGFLGRVAPALPWMVCGWLIGVAVLAIFHLGGWFYLQQVRRNGIRHVPHAVRESFARLKQRMAVGCSVQLRESVRITIPWVFGILRPMVLLPSSVLTGLTPSQVEAILAHELAHVRRHDYLFNLVQTAIETFLFYHPAVWWTSSVVRREREHCCDDCAMSFTDDRVTYASSLARLEEIRQRESAPARSALTMAVTRGSLLPRIRRVLRLQVDERNRSATRIGSGFTVLFLLVAFISCYVVAAQRDPQQISREEKPKQVDQIGQLDNTKAAVKDLTSGLDRFTLVAQFWGDPDDPYQTIILETQATDRAKTPPNYAGDAVIKVETAARIVDYLADRGLLKQAVVTVNRSVDNSTGIDLDKVKKPMYFLSASSKGTERYDMELGFDREMLATFDGLYQVAKAEPEAAKLFKGLLAALEPKRKELQKSTKRATDQKQNKSPERVTRRPIRSDEDILKYAQRFGLNQRVRGETDDDYRRPKFGDWRLEKAEKAIDDIPRPWTVAKFLPLARREIDQPEVSTESDKRLGHLLSVLAASRDPRAAVMLGENLTNEKVWRGRIASCYGMLDYFLPVAVVGGTEQHFEAAQKWWKKNEPKLRAKAEERNRTTTGPIELGRQNVRIELEPAPDKQPAGLHAIGQFDGVKTTTIKGIFDLHQRGKIESGCRALVGRLHGEVVKRSGFKCLSFTRQGERIIAEVAHFNELGGADKAGYLYAPLPELPPGRYTVMIKFVDCERVLVDGKVQVKRYRKAKKSIAPLVCTVEVPRGKAVRPDPNQQRQSSRKKLSDSKNGSPVRKNESLTKAEYLHKAYVLRQGVRPPPRYSGTWRTWHENGNPRSERSLVNGVAHGPSKEWDTQGKRIATGEYRDGDPFDGSFRQWYYLDGDLAKHCYAIDSYSSGRRHGPHSKWTVSGRKLAEGQFAGDERTGRWRWWNWIGTRIAVGTYKDGRPWSGSVVSRSDKQWRVQEYDSGENVQLRRLKRLSLVELAHAVTNRTQHKSVRWHATLELARRKEPSSKPLLITLLKDNYHAVRGAAAWGLSQIGGQDAKDALLAFLRTSLASRNWGDLTRATEAQNHLPDKRALDLLIKCLEIGKENGGDYYGYAAKALGKIGDPKASLALAQQLDLRIDYSMSRDYLYLAAIRKTKGKEATRILIDYLDRLVIRMTGQSLPKHQIGVPTVQPRGRDARQLNYNFSVYRHTLAALETVTGRKSSTGSREDVAEDWKMWWKVKTSGPVAPADAGAKANHDPKIKADVQKPVDPKLLAKLAAQLGSIDFQEYSAALAELGKLLAANKGAEADFAPIIEALFRHAGWGGIARRNARVAENLIVSIGGPALPLLKQRLKSADAHDRGVAAKLLVRIGPPDSSLVALLRPLLQDQDSYVRQAAINGLGVVGPPAKAAIDDLERVATNDPDLSRRVAARIALIKVAGASEERVQALAAFLDVKGPGDDAHVCSYAAAALGNLGPKARAAEPRLLAALKHTRAQVRIEAAHALGQVGANSPETIAALIDLLKHDPAREIRRSAARSLGAIGPKAKAAVPALRKALKGDGQGGWWVAVDALCKIGGADIVPVLVEALANPDVGIRHTAIKRLGNLGADAKPAIVGLEKSRQQDPRDRNRAAAAEALRKIEQAVKKM